MCKSNGTEPPGLNGGLASRGPDRLPRFLHHDMCRMRSRLEGKGLYGLCTFRGLWDIWVEMLSRQWGRGVSSSRQAGGKHLEVARVYA